MKMWKEGGLRGLLSKLMFCCIVLFMWLLLFWAPIWMCVLSAVSLRRVRCLSNYLRGERVHKGLLDLKEYFRFKRETDKKITKMIGNALNLTSNPTTWTHVYWTLLGDQNLLEKNKFWFHWFSLLVFCFHIHWFPIF